MSSPESALGRLLALMAQLRDPKSGCPWDLAQTFRTIAPYTIEEAYEVADAIERDDASDLRSELGDLLFQVVFHARMAEERGWFGFADVAEGITEKLTRRHPHVFAGATVGPADLGKAWEEEKARERAAGGSAEAQEVLGGIAPALPALVRAAKLGRRAGRVGFDWPEVDQVRDKVIEELHEVDEAVAAQRAGTGPAEAVAEEVGDLLFALANWARHLKVDPEDALRAANAKFRRRFQRMEALARERRLVLTALTLAQWEGLWQEAKLNDT